MMRSELLRRVLRRGTLIDRRSLRRRACQTVIAGTLALFAGCQSMDQWPWAAKTPVATTTNLERSLSIARLGERHGRTQEARKVYEKILAEEPNHQVALHRLGIMQARAGKNEAAHQYLSRAEQAAEPTPELLGDIGYLYYTEDNLPLAEQYLQRARELAPQSKSVLNNLGLVLAAEGKYEEAWDCFRQAGDEAEAFANLAYVQSQRGDLPQAEANLHRALELNPQLRPAGEALIQVAARLGNVDPALATPAKSPIAWTPPPPRPQQAGGGGASDSSHVEQASYQRTPPTPTWREAISPSP